MGRFFALVHADLERWVRQLAWLNTAPDRDHKGSGPRPEPVTRLRTIRARGEEPLWPPNPAEYLTNWLIEIGPVYAGAAGPVEIPWGELESWQRQTGIELDAWEARTIRRLSAVYVVQSYDARKPNCPQPYVGSAKVVASRRDVVANQFRTMFMAFAAMKAGDRPLAKRTRATRSPIS